MEPAVRERRIFRPRTTCQELGAASQGGRDLFLEQRPLPLGVNGPI